jgi:hypothetical protein
VLKAAKSAGITKIIIHAFTDGRDTPPKDNYKYLRELENVISDLGIGYIATATGRYFAMDRDKNWERIQKAEDGLSPPMDWKEMTKLRYVDWSITTPIMLTVILLVMSEVSRKKVEFHIWIVVILLNYLMLGIGYAGEIGVLGIWTADFLGFLPFVGMFALIYCHYVMPKYSFNNYLIFFLYLFVWSMYGVFYLFDQVTKNTVFNVLDLISKCLVGLGLWVLFTRIMRE